MTNQQLVTACQQNEVKLKSGFLHRRDFLVKKLEAAWAMRQARKAIKAQVAVAEFLAEMAMTELSGAATTHVAKEDDSAATTVVTGGVTTDVTDQDGEAISRNGGGETKTTCADTDMQLPLDTQLPPNGDTLGNKHSRLFEVWLGSADHNLGPLFIAALSGKHRRVWASCLSRVDTAFQWTTA